MPASAGKSRRTSGSPPVSRTSPTPMSASSVTSRTISSKLRTSSRSSHGSPSAGMQYWQRKLQRSVTETRTSEIRRPWPSISGSRGMCPSLAVGANALEAKRPAPGGPPPPRPPGAPRPPAPPSPARGARPAAQVLAALRQRHGQCERRQRQQRDDLERRPQPGGVGDHAEHRRAEAAEPDGEAERHARRDAQARRQVLLAHDDRHAEGRDRRRADQRQGPDRHADAAEQQHDHERREDGHRRTEYDAAPEAVREPAADERAERPGGE